VTAAAATSPQPRFGGFAVDDMALALPIGALREVVPRGTLLRLPCPAPCLVGGIDLRGVVVPVIDLLRVLGREAPASAPASPHVIILTHGGQLIGLLADGITGIFGASLPAAPPQPAPTGVPPLHAGGLRRDDTGALVSALSPEALAALPGLPVVLDPAALAVRATPATDPAAGSALRQRSQQPTLLLRCGGRGVAIHALAVQATLSDPEVRPSVLARGACLGETAYLGSNVPVVSLSQLCRLGDPGAGRPGLQQAFVMRIGQGCVALLVDEVCDVVGVRPEDVVPVPALALAVPRLFRGTLPAAALPAANAPASATPLGQYLVLDDQSLCREAELAALAQTNTPLKCKPGPAGLQAERAPSAESRGAGRETKVVTFDFGVEMAAALTQVNEILPFDPGCVVHDEGGPLVGLMVHRGRSVPVICLRRLAGLPDRALDAEARVLVVRAGEDWVGFAVSALRAIEPVQWSKACPSGGAARSTSVAGALGATTMALVVGDQERMLYALDLPALAARLQAEALAAA
jgi:purine-binding chemotaxis protein CheW